MKSGITKYRRQQEIAEIDMDALRLDRNAVEGSYEDQLILSEEAAEKLATEAVEEDDDLDIEAIIAKAPAPAPDTKTAKATTAVQTPTKNELKPPLGTREQIILEYAPLIKYIAQKIAARLPANIELDDLMSSGVIGLMDAIEKYDSTRDNKFKTYAEFRIRGAILDELRAQDWVPRSVREKAKMLERAYAKIEHDRGRPATDDEVCEELKLNQEEFHELLNQVRSVSLLSYDDLSSLSKGDRRSIMGMSEAGKSSTPFAEVNTAHLKKLISEAIKDLPEKQRLVLSLYYYEDLNLKEIGKVLDVTESRVSQLHTQAILRLKAKLKGHFDDFLMLFG
jgi:RNA polymerase sigma factor for flagellar operon FliA